MVAPGTDTDVDGLVRSALAAIDAGRALPELDRLVPLASRHVDPRLDRVLVELRHAAFAELDDTPGHPCWPMDHADPFPDEDGLPSIRPERLDGAVLGGALVNHGVLRVDGLVPSADAARLREHIDRTFDARRRCLEADGGEDPEDRRWFRPFAPGRAKSEGFGSDSFVRTVDSPAMLREVATVFERRGVRAAIAAYLGERPAMIANKWVLRRSPSGKIGKDFHQDGAFLGEGIRTVDCWIALSDCGPGTGRPAIDLVPRRFSTVIEGVDAAFDWSITEADVARAAPGAPVLSPVFAAGDALLFDELLPHRTTVGLDLGPRHAIESWFVAPSSYPGKHTPVVL